MRTVLFFVYSNKYICANRIDGIRRYAEKAHWRIQVIERNGGGHALDVKGIVDFWNPIGVIAECGGGMPEISRRTLGDLPVVYLDEDPADPRKAPGLFVNSDSVAIGEAAAKELLSLNLPHFAFVGWKRKRYWSTDRQDAFARILRLHGYEVAVFDGAAATDDLSRRERLRRWLKALPKPCGIFAVHDPVGADILELAALEGIAVPGELAVIGVDDDPLICERTQPSLSSIGVDFEQGGYLCAELLDRAIGDATFSSAAVRYGVAGVTRRESTRLLALADWRVAKAVEFIRRNAAYAVDVADVAKTMGLARRMAEIAFKRHTGHTIHDELTNVRLEKAERLLRNPRQDICAIAGLCGWSSGSVLRKIFKERHGGLSMREWRARAVADASGAPCAKPSVSVARERRSARG